MNRAPALTRKQKELLVKIKNLLREKGVPPTIREIADELGVSSNAAYERLKVIEQKGYIGRTNNKSRSIRILQ